jgi:signal transduction histidine kinase/phage shock protein PspC (stress-responsive transcriptional regulator)
MVAGLAAGIAARLGIGAPYVRAAFVSLAFAGAAGLLLYLLLWVLTPDAASYGRMVKADRPATGRQKLGLGFMFISILVALRAVGLWFGPIVWPVTLLAFGAAVVWDRSGIDYGKQITHLTRRQHRGSKARTQVTIGIVLMVVGVLVLVGSLNTFQTLGSVAIAIVLTAAGFMLVFGPWVWSLLDDLRRERNARIRSEERSEMAAHLHDSVLQTLALIQRTDDPKRMNTLARAQERELRSWLYGDVEPGHVTTVGEALKSVASRTEAVHDVPIDVVVVGDRPTDENIDGLIAAAGEAMVNAARHSGASRVSVYVEAGSAGIEAWITDQGSGFDPASVPPDRRGIAESIRARMERIGGSAEITSTTGEGTEVKLTLEYR